MDIITWTLIIIFLSILGYQCLKFIDKRKYWERRGITCIKVLPFRGLLSIIRGKKSISDSYKEIYLNYPNEKAVGVYEFTTPVLVLRDTKFIERILVKDFQYFTDHAEFNDENVLLKNGLFQLNGNKWRAVRYKISPTFTTGKLKLMFNEMSDCADRMTNILKNKTNTDCEVKDALSTYTIDIIANIVFGVQMSNETARKEFANMGSQFFNVKITTFLKMFFLQLFPKMGKFFELSFLNNDVTNYFKQLIKTTLEQRNNNKYQRNDFVNHLIKLKEQGSIEIQTKDDDDTYLEMDDHASIENIEISEELILGQAFQFLTAGFEPVFNTLMLIMYELARYPETQERARQEVKEILEKHGKYDYEAIKEMTFLEQCIQETLRLHPLIPFLFRQCNKRYVTEDGLEIEKGIKIIIPINIIQMDPQYYPDPETFKPERLPPNSIRNNYTYMPFGDGPRICIGLRFALLELKLGMAKILEKFKFTLSPKTKVPFEINTVSFVPIPTSKILFNISSV